MSAGWCQIRRVRVHRLRTGPSDGTSREFLGAAQEADLLTFDVDFDGIYMGEGQLCSDIINAPGGGLIRFGVSSNTPALLSIQSMLNFAGIYVQVADGRVDHHAVEIVLVEGALLVGKVYDFEDSDGVVIELDAVVCERATKQYVRRQAKRRMPSGYRRSQWKVILRV